MSPESVKAKWLLSSTENPHIGRFLKKWMRELKLNATACMVAMAKGKISQPDYGLF